MGLNDDGSGSAAILDEVALKLAKLKPQNTVRFAWWGDEEGGFGRLDGLRQRAFLGGEGQDRAVPELRHGRVAELLPCPICSSTRVAVAGPAPWDSQEPTNFGRSQLCGRASTRG